VAYNGWPLHADEPAHTDVRCAGRMYILLELTSLVRGYFTGCSTMAPPNSYALDGMTIMAPCMGCKPPYDTGGGCQHEGSPVHIRLAAAFPGVAHVVVCRLLHKSVTTLSIIIQILVRTKLDMLSKLMVLEAPVGSNPLLWTLTEHLAGRDCPAVHLLGLLDNCSSTFHKVAHLTAAAMSLTVCRFPAVALSAMDGGALVNALHLYLKGISHLVQFAIAPLLSEHDYLVEGGGEASLWSLDLLQTRSMSLDVACSI
jgi:hypothetical protein